MTLSLLRVDTYFSVYVDPRDRWATPITRVNATYPAPWSLEAALRLQRALSCDVTDLQETLRPIVITRHPHWSPVDGLNQCSDCEDIGEDFTYVLSLPVCDSCRDNYFYCSGCEDYTTSETYWVDDIGSDLCDACRSDLPWCDECDTRVSHDHDCPNAETQCDCEAPRQSFTFAGLTPDTPHAVSLPEGVLSDEGRAAIRSYLYGHGPANASYLVEDLEPVWMTKRGTFAKRLGSAAHKAGITLSPELLSEVGNLFRAHSGGSDVRIDVTRDFSKGADYFYNSDSCWFNGGEYAPSLCWLKASSGIGLRTIGRNEWDVHGRAWVLPVTVDADGRFASCHENDADAWVVFNGYGDLEGYAGARIVAALTRLSYTKVSLHVSGAYVNGESGYLVGSPELVATRPEVEIREFSRC